LVGGKLNELAAGIGCFLNGREDGGANQGVRLAAEGEAAVGALADSVGLSPSALSQHLARLRDDGLVTTRREAQTIYYRIADPRVARLLALLKDIYCS